MVRNLVLSRFCMADKFNSTVEIPLECLVTPTSLVVLLVGKLNMSESHTETSVSSNFQQMFQMKRYFIFQTSSPHLGTVSLILVLRKATLLPSGVQVW
jgi:hypothetical protein